jgi:hypothetical protein
MRKKLLVILGAGSSIPRDMPSVADLDRQMKQWSQEWSASHHFPDYFDSLWNAAETYYGTGKGPPLNFEKVMGDMLALSHWVTPAPWGDTLRQTASAGAPPGLAFPFPMDYGPAITVTDQVSHLLVELAKYMRALSQRLDSTTNAARQYGTLIDGLRGVFDVGIYNLNYDTAALAAWPDSYTGFGETGTFEPSGVHERREWSFVYHLHGSVHHSLVGPFGEQMCWRRDLADGFFDGHPGLAGDKRSEGRSFPRTTLIAGGFKLDQLLVEPFHSLRAAIARHVYEADAIVIGGYGFGDVHVNRALRNRLTVPGARPPIMVLHRRAAATTDPMAFRDDLWANELCLTLGTNGHFFSEPGHPSPPVPAELATKGAFEVAAPHRVALWHGGFVEAATRLDGIVQWLNGESDGVLIPA